jgi:putative NADH-flavin reductase
MPRRETPDAPKRILVAGASGRLGSRIVLEALAQGHAVTALSRSPQALGVSHPALTLAPLDIRDAAAVAAVVPGHDAVISALGYRRSAESADVLELGIRHLMAGMRRGGMTRLMAIASAGILQLDAQRLRCERPGYPEAFRAGAERHLRVWELLAASELEWTLVCPPELVEGDRMQPVSVRADALPEGPLRVSMEALARWLIASLDDAAWHGRRVGVLTP